MAVPVASGALSVGSTILQQARTPESTLDKLLKFILTVAIIAIIIGVIVALYIYIDNEEAITTVFTTGLLGWLNPFDSKKGDLKVGQALSSNPITKFFFGWWLK